MDSRFVYSEMDDHHSNSDADFEDIPTAHWTDMDNTSDFDPPDHFHTDRSNSASACIGLATLAILLNLYVMCTLIYHKRKAFKNMFYLLVFHCSFVDCIRAISLVLWFLPEMDWFETDDSELLFHFMRIKQFLLIELRSLNMLTILNLLIFTFNEFVVVKRPLHYRRIVRRRAVLLLLIVCWLVCISFGLCSVLIRNYAPQGPMIRQNVTVEEIGHQNSTHWHFNQDIRRHKPGGTEESLQYALIFAVIITCIMCILVVFVCYAQIMLRVRQFNRFDSLKSLTSTSVHDGLRFRGSVSSYSMETKRRRTQILVRHKYLIVIGLVLLVDVLFLVPYSFIQIMQYMHISHESMPLWSHSRWISQLLIALHSVLQPLCYFRMEEFRRLATCKREVNTYGSVKLMNKTAESDDQLAILTEDDVEILALTENHEMQHFRIRGSTTSSKRSHR